MALLFSPPWFRATDQNNAPIPGAFLTFYATLTTTPQPIWSDFALSIALPNPLQSDGNGLFPPIWLDDKLFRYKVILQSPDLNDPTQPGAIVRTIDPYNTSAGEVYPANVAEQNAGVQVDQTIPYGNALRYGLVANQISQAVSNTANLLAIIGNRSPSTYTGPFFFPNLTGSDIYYLSDIIDIRDGVELDLQGCTLSFTKVGGSSFSDSDSGFLFAIRDVVIQNGTVIANYSQSGSSWVNAGDCIALGTRGDSPYFNSPAFDSLMSSPQGNITLRNLHLVCNHAIGMPIYCLGGLQNVVLENVTMDGGGVAILGLYYEFGWATNESDRSARQTSHAHSWKLTNIRATNFASTATAVTFNGAYGIVVDGLYAANMTTAFAAGTGESLFFRPWIGVDDTGAKHNISLQNIVGENLLGTAIEVGGASKPTGGYLGAAWTANTAFILNATRVNGGNWYMVTAAGTSAASGGPSGTGTAITDGGVTWTYLGPNKQTELLEFTLEDFSLTALGSGTQGKSNGAGVRSSGAARATIRGGTIFNHSVGIVTETETTNFTIEGVKIRNSLAQGIQIGLANDIYSPGRLSTGTIRQCFIGGSGAGGTGQSGIQLAQTDSVLIENNRLGYETAHDTFDETTQTYAVRALSGASGVVCRGNYVGTVSGGATAYRNDNATSAGCTVERAQGLQSITGLFDSDLATISADRGDASVTLQVGVDYQVQQFKTVLTANRTVTLSTTGAMKGSKFRIVRTGLGSFTLAVSTLKTIASATAGWVDVEYDGSAWQLTGFGGL